MKINLPPKIGDAYGILRVYFRLKYLIINRMNKDDLFVRLLFLPFFNLDLSVKCAKNRYKCPKTRVCIKFRLFVHPRGYHMKNLYLYSKIAEFYIFCIELQV